MPRSVWFLLSIGPIPGKPVCLKSLAMPLCLYNLSGGIEAERLRKEET